MKRMDFDLFRLEDRVLFEAAAVAEIVEAAEAAQDNPNANVNEAEKQAQDERDALKNAPPENPADQTEQSEGDAQRDPSEAADIDAQVEQLIQGEIPVTDGDVDVTIPELGDSSSAVLEAGESGNLVDALIVPSDATISSGRELVVINGTVPDQDAILAALKPNQEVLVLEDGSGVAELNEYLDAHDGKYDAIHLVTHGNKGYLSINSEIINAENFNAAEWADVGEHLTDDGDILLYGCDTAATAEGRLLVDHIAEASGADVAASTDATGISGDWTLEYQHGVIDSAEISVENFEHNLTNYAVTNLNDSGDGSLRWAVEQANANAGTDEITFSTNGTIVLESEINITDGVTITGNGAESTVIDGNNTTRIFTIKNGICNLRKITFQNGYSDSYGGAIHAEDSILRLEDSSFLENNVVDGKGGAIWARAISLDVINCNFSKNSNAIYCIVADHLNVENSTFIQNTVDVPDFNGAAIRIVNTAVLGSTPLPILINNCSFIGNSSSGNGGAISCSSLSAVARYSNLIILNCTFAENYATTNGGAVFKDNTCDLFIANSILVGNRAGNIFEDIYGATTAYYSLIGNAEGTLTGIHNQIGVVSSLVYGSEVPSVSVENVDGVEHSYCSILRSEWTLAGTKTGIYSEGQAEKIVILNEDQWIVVDDPAITVEAIDVIELTTDQLGNIRQDNGEYIIGAVNSSFELPIEMASLTVSTSEDIWDISDNRISLREAIAYAALGVSDSSGNKIITFDNNIFSTYSTITLDSAYGMLQIANGVFSNANPLIIDGSIGNNRTVTFDGGSVSQILRIGQTNTLYLNNLTFQNGSASNGGAIYTTGDSLVVNNSTFINNCAQNGGSIYNEEGALTIINSTFTKNTAQVGGALYNKGSLTILNTILVGNDTNDIFNNGNGRAYYSLIGTVSLENWSTEAGSMNNVSVEDTFLVDSDGNIVIESDEMAHVKYGGLAHGKGIYVWHNEDYSAIAYSVTKEGQKTAVTGNIDDATICISIDQRGRERIDPVDIGAEVVTQKNIIIEPESPDFLYSIIAQEYDGTTIVDNAVIQVVVDGKIIELSWKSAFFNSADVLGVTTATFKDLSCKDIAYKLSSDTITLDATEKIIAKDITVTADAQTKVYGSADPELTYQVSGLVGNDTLSGELSRAVGEDVGDYAITQGTLANSNYNINFTGANLTVTAKELVIDPSDPVINPDDPDPSVPALSYTVKEQIYDGDIAVDNASIYLLIDGKRIALTYGAAVFNSANVLDVSTITFSNLKSSDNNYALSIDGITLDATEKIIAKDITVTADAQTKVYGSADPELTYQVSGLVGNDTLSGELSRAVGEDVGEYAITQGTLANSNYKINFTGANLTITAKSDVVVKPSGLNFDQYSEAVNPNFSALHPALTGHGLASVGLLSTLNENVYAMNHSTLHAHLELRNGLRGSINNEMASGRAVLPMDHSMMTIDAPLKNHSGFLFSRTMVMKPEALANGKEIMIDNSLAELRQVENTSAAKTHSSWHFLPEPVKLPRSFFIDDVPADELPDLVYDLRGIRAELPRRADAFKSELELLLEELVGA